MRWWGRGSREDDLEREVRSDLESEVEEQIARGVRPEEAHFAAHRAFGNAVLIKEQTRDSWGWRATEQLWQDLKFAARTLSNAPAFAAATILTLALGIGANSTIFSVVNGILLKPLPFAGSDRLVRIHARDAQGQRQSISQPDLDDWRTMANSFRSLASWVPQSVNLTGLDHPERVAGLFVSSNFLPMFGASPVLGRGFATGEDRLGGERVAVLSDSLWRNRFAADPKAIGKTAEFNGEPYTVIGVLSKSFVVPFTDADVLLPAFKYPNYSMDRSQTSCAVIGQLNVGSSVKNAQAELNTVAERLASAYPLSNKGRGAAVLSLKEDIVADLKPSVTALAGSVAFVLLIGCTNVASLLIARMVARERELAVRVALGASRARLLSHTIAEALLMAAVGGGLGLLFSLWSVPLIASSIAVYVPNGTAITLDYTVVVFTLAVSLISAVLVAIIPAWQSTNAVTLRAGRGAGSGARKNRSRSVLVAVEIALAMVLLVGAGLMIKSFSELGRAEPGFDTKNLLTLAYRVPRSSYPTGPQQTRFHNQVIEKIKAVPGVLSATSVRAVPLGGNGNSAEFLLAGQPEPPASERPRALMNFADPNFFTTMRIPVLRGRTFSGFDGPEAPYVVVINRTLAHRYFGDTDPVGQHLRIPFVKQTGQIVGVVEDVKQFSLADPPAPHVFGALAQNPFIFTSVAVRTAGDPLGSVNQIRDAIWRVDRNQPVWSIFSFNEILLRQSRLRQLVTTMLAGYAGVALLLASIGIFGVVSYTVSQRTAEIGIRIALGARSANVAGLIFKHGLFMILAGIGTGLGIAVWLSRYLRTQLYAVSALDPGVYATVAALLAIVAILACAIPARRASKVDPIVALRYE